jgi:C1A family cysteine protease
MKAVLIATLLIAATFAQSQVDLRDMFNSWKIQHGKVYLDEAEEDYRFGVFTQMYFYIQGFNAAGNTARLGLNAFSDLTSEEFKALYTGSKVAEGLENLGGCDTPAKTSETSWNWATNTSIVTPVKNQQQCGSCWAFASVAVSESLYALNGNPLTSFSEQQVVSCDTNCDGCNGGFPQYALQYIAQEGLETETAYPYTATTGRCEYNKAKATQTGVTGPCSVQPRSVQALNDAIVQQPTVVLVEADQAAWQSYAGGVISKNCGAALDHAVTATGFTDSYFIIKNSWGESWGENGYVWVSNDASENGGVGVCGILSQPVFPAGLKSN